MGQPKCECELRVFTIPALRVYLENVDKRESATLAFYYKTGQAMSVLLTAW